MSVAAAAAALRGAAGTRVSLVMRSGTTTRTLSLVRFTLNRHDMPGGVFHA